MNILEAIEKRNMFSVFRSSFHARNLPVSQGWEKTKESLEIALKDPELNEKIAAELLDSYRDNVLFSQKAVFLWALDNQEVADILWRELDTFVNLQSPYLETYPLPLSSEKLDSTHGLSIPTAIEITEHRKSLVFAGKRWFNEELSISKDSLRQNVRDAYAGLTELIAKRQVCYPIFDSITIDKTRRLVEIRIDQAKNINEHDLLQYRTTLQEKFNNFAQTALGVERPLGDPVNLFPAIDYLYDGVDWRVHSIEHTNDGGYLNKNRGRRRLSDVREDEYHSAGEDAVPAIHLHSITACWDLKDGVPKLLLHGHSKILSSHHPSVDLVRIQDCWDSDSYYKLMDTLIMAISPSKT